MVDAVGGFAAGVRMLSRVPEQANVLLVVDNQALLKSPLAQVEHWEWNKWCRFSFPGAEARVGAVNINSTPKVQYACSGLNDAISRLPSLSDTSKKKL